MPQSLSKLYIHLVFSTKNRARILHDSILPELHAYMGGTLRRIDCVPLEINSEPDHTHILFILGRAKAVSEVVSILKRSATDWLRLHGTAYRGFHWQTGYGAFSVSQSVVDAVRDYIRNQREHHRVKSFQDEYRALLHKYEIDFEERYVWD